MADMLARTFATEEDKMVCPFWYKMGACRHGDRCSRMHIRPLFSQTLLMPHLYQNGAQPDVAPPAPIQDQEQYENFAEEMYDELSKYGELEDLVICDNLGHHLIGNVYAKFSSEEEAERALKALHGRFYNGVLVLPEYCTVTDFDAGRCRQHDEGRCDRSHFCNFLHIRRLPRSIRKLMKESEERERREGKDRRGGGGGGGKGRCYKCGEPGHQEKNCPNGARPGGRDRGRDDRGGRDGGRDRDRGRDGGRDRDRDRDRGRDRERESSRRHRSRSRERDSQRDKERDASEERRAMIAKWNNEIEPQSSSSGQVMGQPSESISLVPQYSEGDAEGDAPQPPQQS